MKHTKKPEWEATLFNPEFRPGTSRVADWEPSSFTPSLPYAGSSGWSGTDTSRERADTADHNSVTSKNQQQALDLLRSAGYQGMTWKELSLYTGLHHGTTSGALSVLHKTRRIARLMDKRDGCRIYVNVDFVQNRETDEQGTKKTKCPNCGHIANH